MHLIGLKLFFFILLLFLIVHIKFWGWLTSIEQRMNETYNAPNLFEKMPNWDFPLNDDLFVSSTETDACFLFPCDLTPEFFKTS